MVERSPYLTVDEAAALMRCSRQTVYALVKAGDLAARRIGLGTRKPHIRIARVDLDRYLAETTPQRGAAG
jgi:excisionase family DNA binding protein